MIKIAVCDDEISAIQNISNKIEFYLNKKGMDFSISKFLNGESLLSNNNEYFDAVFLDIKMNKINGMDTAKAIRKDNDKTAIIFVTVLKEYVFDAFQVNAANYLIKPVQNEKLYAVLDKLVETTYSSANNYIVIHKSGEIKKVPYSDIIYCEVVNHHVFIYEKSNINEYGSKIDNLENEFNEDFFRCHRSYIVNLRYVNRYSDGFIYLPGGEKVPVATRRHQDFMKALLHYHRKEVR